MADKKLSLEFLRALFMYPRNDHPGRKATAGQRGRGHGRMVSGNSKYHRKMVAQGLK